MLMLDFRGDTLDLYRKRISNWVFDSIPLDSFQYYAYTDNVISYSHSDGSLDFLTSWCRIRRFDDPIEIEGGEELIPNNEALCPSGSRAYVTQEYIPAAEGQDHGYYIYCGFDQNEFIRFGALCDTFYLCHINTDLPDPRLYNCTAIADDSLYQAGIGSIKHANNRDWWLVKLQKFSERIFLYYLDTDLGRVTDTLIVEQGAPY